MRIAALLAAAALLAGCATPAPDTVRLADPYTAPEIPEIYETPPDVKPLNR